MRLIRLELLDRLVHRHEVVGRRLNHGRAIGQLDAPTASAVLVGPLAPRLLDEDVAHRPRRRAEEVAPAVPAGVVIADQAQVCLVDQGCRLKGLARRQSTSQRRGQSAQLSIDDRQQLGRWLHF